MLSFSSFLVRAPPRMMDSCVSDDHRAGQGAVRQKEVGPLWSVSSAIKNLILRLLH